MSLPVCVGCVYRYLLSWVFSFSGGGGVSPPSPFLKLLCLYTKSPNSVMHDGLHNHSTPYKITNTWNLSSCRYDISGQFRFLLKLKLMPLWYIWSISVFAAIYLVATYLVSFVTYLVNCDISGQPCDISGWLRRIWLLRYITVVQRGPDLLDDKVVHYFLFLLLGTDERWAWTKWSCCKG